MLEVKWLCGPFHVYKYGGGIVCLWMCVFVRTYVQDRAQLVKEAEKSWKRKNEATKKERGKQLEITIGLQYVEFQAKDMQEDCITSRETAKSRLHSINNIYCGLHVLRVRSWNACKTRCLAQCWSDLVDCEMLFSVFFLSPRSFTLWMMCKKNSFAFWSSLHRNPQC